MGEWEEEDGVTSGEAVALRHPPLKHTAAVALPPTRGHCTEVVEKDTTCTGSEVKQSRACVCKNEKDK